MKLTVNKYLNARSGKPSTASPCPFYKSPGDVLEIDHILVGDEIDGNAIWYHCKDDGSFYWSGGIEETAFEMQGMQFGLLPSELQYAMLLSLKNYFENFLSRKVAGYMGCAIGNKNDDPLLGLALIVYVEKKFSSDSLSFIVPPFILFKGIKVQVDVKEVSTIEHEIYIDHTHTKPPPIMLDNDTELQMGGSISVSNDKAYGTRTIRLKKEGILDFYLMTCFHVLIPERFKAIGIYTANDLQIEVSFPCENRKFGSGHVNKAHVVKGKYNNLYDYAIIELKDKSDVFNGIGGKRFNGFYTFGQLATLLNKTVTMIGATSFKQQGKVMETHGSVSVANSSFEFNPVIVCERLSSGGDSGAPVVDENNKLVGYVIGGNKKNRTIILPVYNLFLQEGFTF